MTPPLPFLLHAIAVHGPHQARSRILYPQDVWLPSWATLAECQQWRARRYVADAPRYRIMDSRGGKVLVAFGRGT